MKISQGINTLEIHHQMNQEANVEKKVAIKNQDLLQEGQKGQKNCFTIWKLFGNMLNISFHHSLQARYFGNCILFSLCKGPFICFLFFLEDEYGTTEYNDGWIIIIFCSYSFICTDFNIDKIYNWNINLNINIVLLSQMNFAVIDLNIIRRNCIMRKHFVFCFKCWDDGMQSTLSMILILQHSIGSVESSY